MLAPTAKAPPGPTTARHVLAAGVGLAAPAPSRGVNAQSQRPMDRAPRVVRGQQAVVNSGVSGTFHVDFPLSTNSQKREELLRTSLLEHVSAFLPSFSIRLHAGLTITMYTG